MVGYFNSHPNFEVICSSSSNMQIPERAKLVLYTKLRIQIRKSYFNKHSKTLHVRKSIFNKSKQYLLQNAVQKL